VPVKRTTKRNAPITNVIPSPKSVEIQCVLFFEDFKDAKADGPVVDSSWKCHVCRKFPALHLWRTRAAPVTIAGSINTPNDALEPPRVSSKQAEPQGIKAPASVIPSPKRPVIIELVKEARKAVFYDQSTTTLRGRGRSRARITVLRNGPARGQDAGGTLDGRNRGRGATGRGFMNPPAPRFNATCSWLYNPLLFAAAGLQHAGMNYVKELVPQTVLDSLIASLVEHNVVSAVFIRQCCGQGDYLPANIQNLLLGNLDLPHRTLSMLGQIPAIARLPALSQTRLRNGLMDMTLAAVKQRLMMGGVKLTCFRLLVIVSAIRGS
jgi:hypothetical protein